MGLPSGIVTFLFTDLEGSTVLWDTAPAAMREAVPLHDTLVTAAIERNGGAVFKQVGDGLCAAFDRPDAAVRAAIEAQEALAGAAWPEGLPPLRARMGLHTGTAEPVDGDYLGPTLNRVARLMSVGHGGHVLVSSATERLVGDALPPGATLLDLGSHRLKGLSSPEQIFQVCHPALTTDLPPISAASEHVGNLPLQVSSFVGREEQIERLASLLEHERLITLTGVGGVGKTRLAVETAAALRERFVDDAWLIELAPLGDPAAVPHSIASVMGVQETPGTSVLENLVGSLRPRDALLILDNCEHVLGAVGEVTEAILRACRSVRIVATSREPLGVEGERIVAVASLGVPDAEADIDPGTLEAYPSVALFMDRARSGRPDLRITDDNAAAIAEICRRLDGVPLALELAAARVRSMSPAEIASRLDERFRLLRGGRRTAMERHQTLRATVEWSYGLLREDERTLFDRLSVFAGGFTTDAAVAVCAIPPLDEFDIEDLIVGLTEKSMLLPQEQPDGSTRFSMLETIRQFGESRLVDSEDAAEIGRRHAETFAALTSEAYDGIRSPDEARWVAILDREFDNIRAAHGWAMANEHHTIALGVPADIEPYSSWRLRTECYGWAKAAISVPGADADVRYGDACASAAFAAGTNNEIEFSERLAAIGEERASNEHFRAMALYAAGVRGFFSGDPRAFDRYEVARDASLAIGDLVGAAMSEGGRTLIALYQQRDDVLALLESSVDLAERSRHPSSLAFARYSVGEVFQQTDPARAEAALEEAIAIAREVRNRFVVGIATVSLASVKAYAGKPLEAAVLLVEAMKEWRRRGNWRQQWVSLRNAIEHLGRLELFEDAASLYEGVRSHQPTETAWGPQGERLAALEAVLRERVSEGTYEAITKRARLQDPDELVTFAIERLEAAAAGTGEAAAG